MGGPDEDSTGDLFEEEISMQGDPSLEDLTEDSVDQVLEIREVVVQVGEDTFTINPGDDLDACKSKLEVASRIRYGYEGRLKVYDLLDECMRDRRVTFDDPGAAFMMRYDPQIGERFGAKRAVLSRVGYGEMIFNLSSMNFWDDLEKYVEYFQERAGLDRVIIINLNGGQVLLDEEVHGVMSVMASLPVFEERGRVAIRLCSGPLEEFTYQPENFCGQAIPKFFELRHHFGEKEEEFAPRGFTGSIIMRNGESLPFSAANADEIIRLIGF